VPFFKLALLNQLLRRPYHVVTLEGPFNLKPLVEDHHDRMFRSEAVITDAAKPKLPPSAGCGLDERIVLVPRKTLVLAKPDIPN
jgi:hypothetical protein